MKGKLYEAVAAWDNLKPDAELCALLKVRAKNYADFTAKNTP